LPDRADPARGTPEEIVTAIERSCAGAEEALRRCAWDELSGFAFEQRRLTHALEQAVERLPPGSRIESVVARLREVERFRADQLHRLERYRDDVGERLKVISLWRSAARSLAPSEKEVPAVFDGLG
jgi:hypothetical protein